MKKIFIAFLGLLAFTLNAQAQKKSGAIQFESVIDPVAAAEASGRQIPEEMKARMPKSIKANYELLYNATNASFMPVTETEDSNSGGGGRPGGGFRFGFGGGGNREYYYTFADQKVVEVFDMMDTTYVMPTKLAATGNNPMNGNGGRNNNQSNSAVQFLNVPPTIEVIKTDETKKIVNLDCKKVIIRTTRKAKVLNMDKDVVEETVLWYTNDLGFNFSPMPNLWTEGAVLAIEIKGGGTTAKSIEYRGVSNKDVTAPKKAVAITPEQYQAKMEAMMARFRNNNNRGQGGQTRAVIN
ncbi:hypothetical protein [Pedobacter chitinilyticus]|uniref:GLPGLI family protein n=1 Tax=Pedobacter chitinilyticus TaxID=2233776 RepID=A0A443Z1K9_9SPHI|nr:hypothetical protein [Pedobacter chitinilyticus]RWU10370.1 hypothetical protein DPV69_03250 [Pedobacter chitinilyticus]